MQVKIEDINSIKKKIHVEIPQEKITDKLDEAYKQLKKTARLKGYRPGKTPRSVLERHFKKDVHADIVSSLIQESFPEAIKETDLNVLDTPEVDTPELDPDNAYKYVATVELKPELPEVEFKGLNLKKTLYKIDESEIEAQIDRLRKHLAKYEPIEEKRPVEQGDYVVLDHQGFKDGQPFEPAAPTSDDTLKIGASGFPEEFDTALVGMQPGEEKEIAVKFPDDYQKPELAGNQIVYHVVLKEIRREILPPVDDEFAKNFGEYETIEALRDEIRSNLEQGYQKRTDQELQEQIFEHLLTEEFEIPEVMVKYEMDEIMRDAEMKFAQNGLSMEQLGLTREHMEEQYRGVAEQQVRRHLVLNKIIEQENIEISDEQLEPEYEKIAQATGQQVDMIKTYYQQNPERLEGFKHALLEKQAIDLIIKNANVEEFEPEKEKTEETD
jgi:trigger factor